MPAAVSDAATKRLKLYYRTSKPARDHSKASAAAVKIANVNDLEPAASVNRQTAVVKLQRGGHGSKYDNTNGGGGGGDDDDDDDDFETQESTQKIGGGNSRPQHNRRVKPSRPSDATAAAASVNDNAAAADQEMSPSVLKNNLQRRVSKPNKGNFLPDNENAAVVVATAAASTSDQENLSSTNRLKIRRRISKPENLNSAATVVAEETKNVDSESSLANRFKFRQKLNTTAAASNTINGGHKSAEEATDAGEYKVRKRIPLSRGYRYRLHEVAGTQPLGRRLAARLLFSRSRSVA